MRTMGYMSPEKQRRISRETLDIYAPLASLLGIWQIKWELEDLAFRYLEPEHLSPRSKKSLNQRRAERETLRRARHGDSEDGAGQAWHPGRDHRPPQAHLQHLAQDAARRASPSTRSTIGHGVRVIVPEIGDCYAALGVVHTLWRPIPGEFDDYIASPKENLYQSLHTAVIGPRGPAAGGADPHAGDAPHRRDRHRRALALQDADHATTRPTSARSPGCAR